jgi:SAM-dependent methyltransferase
MRDFAGTLLAPLFPSDRDWHLLDAGCGTGGMLSWLERFAAAKVIGIDLSSDALRFSHQRGHGALVQGSVMSLPFANGSFDLVMSADVLQHLPDPPGDTAALAESYRVLRAGGYFYVRTNSSFGLGSPGASAAGDYRRYRRAELVQRLEAAGFLVERVTYANSLPSLAAIARQRLRGLGTPMHHHSPNPGLTLHVRPAHLRWIDHALTALLHAEAWYVTRLGRNLSFGHTLLALVRKPLAAPMLGRRSAAICKATNRQAAMSFS